jgi:hypothetical protein
MMQKAQDTTMREAETTFRIVDRRHTALGGETTSLGSETTSLSDLPAGYRAHSVLLGHQTEDQALAFLRDKGVHPEATERLLAERARAESRIRALPPFAPAVAAQPVQDGQALADISHIMSRPECKAAFPEGKWTAELVEIASLIPAFPSLDVRYGESFGGSALDPANPLSAVRLCFNPKHASPFHVSLDQQQKSVSIVGNHPALEVVSVRCSQQAEDGRVLVSFMIAAQPNLVVVLRHRDRLLLCGGSHRLYRLLQAGFTQAPCVVEDSPGLGQIARYGSFFFPEPVLMAPRPPLFTHFADPELGIVAPLRARRKVTRIRPDEYSVVS